MAMNSDVEVLRTARLSAARFTEDSRWAANPATRSRSNGWQHNPEVATMIRTNGRNRTSYARALYAAAVAALLSACAQTSSVPPDDASVASSAVTNADMPEVVVTASRTHADSIG
jgi:hypothetical protein